MSGKDKATKYKYILSTIIAIALFSTIVLADVGDNPGQVIDNPWAHLFTTTPTTEAPTTEAPTETTYEEGYYDVSPYRSTTPYTHPTKDGKLFAGWYTDSTCSTPYTKNTGVAYAKFVDESVMTVKYQDKTEDGKRYIRFLSSVDCLEYNNVGFSIVGTYGTAALGPVDRDSTVVYTSVLAGGQKVLPSVFSEESSYIFTYVLKKIDPSKYLEVNMTPFWTTQDGTKVEGISRTITYQAS